MKTLVEPACWRHSQIAETFASVRVSAPCYRLAEYVGFSAIIVAVLKLRQVQRQVFLADVMEGSHDAALQERPEVIQILGVNDATHIFFGFVINGIVRVANTLQAPKLSALVGSDQFYFLGIYYLADESFGLIRADFFDHLANHVALARDRADDWNLAVLSPATGIALGLVHLAAFAADEGFINFHNPHQLTKLGVLHSGAEPHADVPSGLIFAGSEHPVNLQRADALLGGEHQMENLEPHTERLFSFLENRSSLEREAIGRAIILAAFLTLPVPGMRFACVHMIVAATRAFHTAGPAAREQIRPARFLIGEHSLELGKRQLRNQFRLCVSFVHHDSDISKKRRGSQQRGNCHLVQPDGAGFSVLCIHYGQPPGCLVLARLVRNRATSASSCNNF